MKSFTHKALALAAASVCGSTAMAATVTAGGATQFAAETMTSTTAVKVPNIALQLAIGRTAAQDFTVVIKPTGTTKFDTASCSTTLPVFNAVANGTANVSVKRASTTECAYEVDVTANFLAADNGTVTFSNLKINSHGLATVGGTESVTVGIWDLGETARIDNSADVTVPVAASQRATSLTATADTETVIDVDHASGALFGFKASGAGATADDATNAIAKFDVNINASLKDPNLAAVTNAIITQINFTVAGDFSGLANFTSGSTVRVENTSGAVNATPTVTISGAAGSQTATFSALGTDLSAAGTATSVYVKLASLKTSSLGTSRDYGISAVADPSATGVADFSLGGANATWWQMRANAIELRSAFFNNDGDFVRFFFQNTGSADAPYSATCYAEDGVTATMGTAKTGVIKGGKMTVVAAKDVCSFSTGKRGAVTFVINAKAANVKGVYQQAVNGLSAGYIALERPYGDPAGKNGAVY